MYSPFQIVKKFIHYYFTASNGKGHGIHSPFVFNFITAVLNDKKKYAWYDKIEPLRRQLLRDSNTIDVTDFGAGSAVIKTRERIVREVAASSLKSKKFAQLLFRIAQYCRPVSIIELGTSFGISSAYLAAGNVAGTVFTLEGASSIADIAQQNFDHLGLKNIYLLRGDFEESLPVFFSKVKQVNLAFIDGNHRKLPTLKYFNRFLESSTPSSILIFDDIHWSAEMEEAWAAIQQHPSVTLTIDLFFIGLVFINPDFKVKQHFKIRF